MNKTTKGDKTVYEDSFNQSLIIGTKPKSYSKEELIELFGEEYKDMIYFIETKKYKGWNLNDIERGVVPLSKPNILLSKIFTENILNDKSFIGYIISFDYIQTNKENYLVIEKRCEKLKNEIENYIDFNNYER